MKAITLYQPWASLIVVGAKLIETRSWKTGYRGPIAIHAGANKAHAARLCSDPLMRSALGGSPFAMPRGAIVAVARLIGCYQTPIAAGTFCVLPTGQELPPDEPERSFGDYTPGRHAWLLADVRPLRTPVPAKGALGLWAVPDDVAAQVEAQL